MAAEVDCVPRYTDIREEDEYILDEERHDTVHEILERYKFTFEFLSQQLQCSRCGHPYRPKDNFAGFGCSMHPGSLRFDRDTGLFSFSCCGQSPQDAHITVGCVPCIHSFRKQDFNDIVLTQEGNKYLPAEMVDILRPFPIDRQMIIGTDCQRSRYIFATSKAQLLRQRALAHPDRKVGDDDDEGDEYGDAYFEQDDDDEEDMLKEWEESHVVADDNWKIKMYIH